MAGQEPTGSTVTDYDGWTWQQIKQAIVGGGTDLDFQYGAADPGVSSPSSFYLAGTAFDEAHTQLDQVHDKMLQWMGSVFGPDGSYQGDAADTLHRVLTEFVNLAQDLAAPLPAYKQAMDTAGKELQRAIEDILAIDRAGALSTVANWLADNVTFGQQPTPQPYRTGDDGHVTVDVSTDPLVSQQMDTEMRVVINRLAGVYRQSEAALVPPKVNTQPGGNGTGTGVADRPLTGPATDGDNGTTADQPGGPAGDPAGPGRQDLRIGVVPAPGGPIGAPPLPPMTSGKDAPGGQKGLLLGADPAARPAGNRLPSDGGFLNLPPQPYVDLVRGPNRAGSAQPPDPQDPRTRLARLTVPPPGIPYLPHEVAPGPVVVPGGRGVQPPALSNLPQRPVTSEPAVLPPTYSFPGMGAWGQANETSPPTRRLIDLDLDGIRPRDLGLGDVKVTDVHSGGPVPADLSRHGQAPAPGPFRLSAPELPVPSSIHQTGNLLLGPKDPATASSTMPVVDAAEPDVAVGAPPMFLGGGIPGSGEHGGPRNTWLLEREDVWSSRDERGRRYKK